MITKILITISLVVGLSGCSSLKQVLATAGSFAGAAYARDKGENAYLGSIAGGLIGNLAGQMISQSRPY